MGDSREHSQNPVSDEVDDESGLELSLGLSCGGSISKPKGKDGTKEINTEQGGGDKVKNGKMSIGDTSMKHFLQGSVTERDTEIKQTSEPIPQSQQNFWTNLGKTPAKEPENSMEMHINQVQFPGFRESWFAGENSTQVQDMSLNMEKTNIDQQQRQTILNQQQEVLEQQRTREIADQKWQEARKKRQKVVEEQKQQTKGEVEDDRADQAGRTSSAIPSQLKSSPISAATQDVSSPDNEDTADSEVEGSSSRMVSPIVKDCVKQSMPTGTDVSEKKENQILVQRTTAIGNESISEHSNTLFMNPGGTTNTTLPYSLQSFPVGHLPYTHSIQVSNSPGLPVPAGFSLPYMMQFMPPTVNGADRSAVRPMNSSGFQLPLGYAPFQLPTLETSSSRVSVSHSHQPLIFGPKNIGGARTSLEHVDDEPRISQAAIQATQGALGGLRSASSETASQEGQKLESAKSLMKEEQQLERTGSDVGGTSLYSKAVDDDAKGHVGADHLPITEGVSQEIWNLRPGIAPGLKFGGTGNSPDLPWVTTSGIGPNGKTISGVMYRYNRNQVKIVCACHGRHMSPSEFVQHAGGADTSNPDNNVVVNSFSNGNHTSAQG